MIGRLAAEADALNELRLTGSGRPDGMQALVALILGRGRITARALASSRRLLRRFARPGEMQAASLEELRRSGGLSARQAELLRAALLLGRCCSETPLQPGEQFSNSRDLFQRYRGRFLAATREYFLSLELNAKNRLIREVLVSVGSLSSAIVHPREVFSPAVRDSAAAVIFLHNHPSGDPAPSPEDRDCTDRLVRAGRILGIRVLDHIVLGFADYYSFADAGTITRGA